MSKQNNSSLPNNWVTVPLKDITLKIVDGSHNPPRKQDNGMPMLSARNINNNQINFDIYRLISEKDFEHEHNRTRITPGDVLLTIVGTIGRSAIVPDGIKPFTLQRSVAVLTLKNIVPKYMMYQLQSPFFQRHFKKVAKGTAQKGVYLRTLGQSTVRVAPLNEQKRIVAEIEKQFSRLDEAVDNLKRVKANLKRYKASVLKAAVEGKLTEEWRTKHKDVEPAYKLLERILSERRKKWEEAELAKMKAKGKVPKDDNWKKKYKEPPQVDVTLLPVLPNGWTWANFERLAENIPNALKAGPFGSSLKKSFYVPYGYKIYGQEQVLRNDHTYGDYYIDEGRYEKLKNCAVKPGDILISLVGTIGKVFILPDEIEPGIINPRLVKFSLDRRIVDVNYIKIYLQSPYVKYLFSIASHGGTMDILNLTILKKIPIPVPPLEEQKKIVEELERVSSIEAQFTLVIEANDKRADRLRQSVLKKAFSGKIIQCKGP